MTKQSISILFSVIFLLSITTPAIVVVVDNTTDMSFAISTSEEKDKGFEFAFLNTTTIERNIVYNSVENNLDYYLKKHPNPYLIFISQPPEQVFYS